MLGWLSALAIYFEGGMLTACNPDEEPIIVFTLPTSGNSHGPLASRGQARHRACPEVGSVLRMIPVAAQSWAVKAQPSGLTSLGFDYPRPGCRDWDRPPARKKKVQGPVAQLAVVLKQYIIEPCAYPYKT